MEAENITYSRKIRIYPNNSQLNLFKKCFDTSRYLYNKAVEVINTLYKKKLSDYVKCDTCIKCSKDKLENSFFCKKHKNNKIKWDLPLTLPKLRPLVMKSDKDLDEKEIWQKEVPYDTRQLILNNVIGAFKACITNKKNGNINNFKVSFKTRKSPKQIFHVEKSAIKYMSIFKRRLKKDSLIRIRKRYNKYKKYIFKHNCVILKDYNRYFLLIPKDRKVEPKKEADNALISLDPGVRSFQTFYSPDGYIGKAGIKLREKLKTLKEKVSHLQSKICKVKARTKYHMKNKCSTLRAKMCNILNDFHWKLCAFLVDNFNIIIIPTFDTSDMVTKKDRRIGKETVKDMLNLSHYKFKSKLIYKCKEHNRLLKIVTEEYTSKTCTNCGWINNKLGGSKTFKCEECNLVIDRDVNGARNIMLKTFIGLDTTL
jgi:putative transposase